MSDLFGLGAMVSGLYAGRNASDADSRADIQAGKAREWQETMSNTAHQREVRDLTAAGLNPKLSAGGGSGASTPPGAVGQTFLPQTPQIEMPDLLQYGMETKKLEQQQQALELQNKGLNIQDKLATSTIVKNANENELTKMKTILEQKGMPRAMLEGEGAKVLKNVIDWMKKSYNSSQPPKPDPIKGERPPDSMWNNSVPLDMP